MARASRSEWDCGDGGEALGPGAQLEAAADDVQPLPDSADPHSHRSLQGGALLDGRAAAFVRDLDDRVALLPAQEDVRPVAAGVSVDVGEALLDDGEQRQLDCLEPVGRLAAHLEPAASVEELAETQPYDIVVIGDQDAHGASVAERVGLWRWR